MGHIVEDSNQRPRGDLIAREIFGGMLDVDSEVVKRQGRWLDLGNGGESLIGQGC